MEIDLQEDLNAINNQLTRLVDELNKLNAGREQLIQQIQNLNGVTMYLRGKQPPEEQGQKDVVMAEAPQESSEDVTRTVEYPNE